MKAPEGFELAVAFICLGVFSVLFVFQAKKRQKEKLASSYCYLKQQFKPQYSFKQVLADNSFTHFNHFKLVSSTDENASSLHPYEAKVKALVENPPIEYSFAKGETDFSLHKPCTWVDTEARLQELADRLKTERVFAVDTEQHSLRSFLGFTALIQISTIEEDYLVDALALHDVMDILHPIFSDKSICKRADWRQRPLSDEMIIYARTDAHFLLYIAERLNVELKLQSTEKASLEDEHHFLREASRRSNMICMQLYAKDNENIPGELAASSIISRYLNNYSGTSQESHEFRFQAFVRRLCMWREIMARIHDESIRFVLSDQAIVHLAYNVPRTAGEIYDAVSQAHQSVDSLDFKFIHACPSPVICSHVDDLCELFEDMTCSYPEFFESILQKHLGPKGNCPLSLYNYSVPSQSSSRPGNRSLTINERAKNARQMSKKASRDLFVQKFSCKAPVYHNCRIYASDSRLLCYCDRKKLEWYLRRGLAEVVDENPPAIMLLFEPKGRPEDEGNDFYIQSKKNICVGCGENKHYLRYRIIPSCYRIHFPEHLKSHRSHDIVLLCVDCHELAHSAAEKYKKQVAAEYGAPLFVQKVVDAKTPDLSESSFCLPKNYQRGVSPLQLRMAAMALLRHGTKMPLKRHEELAQIIMEYYGKRETSQEDLENALFVGMSPHEKRRLKKKEGMLFRGEACITRETMGADVTTVPTRRFNSSGMLDRNNVHKSTYNLGCNMNADDYSDGGSLDPGAEPSSTSRHNVKLSLLGHGPHGKAVVDSILKEYGEDGISQFCQRWRQIFVEAIHPQFLPAGWDVMHSGRREFGEYSVYNNAKSASIATNVL